MEKPTYDQVLQAINLLYDGQNPHTKEEASKWLENLQRSLYAWEVADHLLSAKTDSTSCYFGAQTMRTKIQYFFHELQPNQYQSLKESLLNHITNLHSSTQAIINQLCLAVVDLAVQMPQWTNPVQDLVNRFSKSMETIPELVEMLQFLTEEVKSEHLRVGANRREEVTNQLRQSSLMVIHLLNACIDQCPKEDSIRRKIFSCFGSWLVLGAFPVDEVMKSKLLPTLFDILRDSEANDDLQESAADCLCDAIYAASDVSPQNQMSTVLFSEVIKLVSFYQRARSDFDYNRCLIFSRIFTELAESTLESAVNAKTPVDLRCVEMVVQCVQHNDYEVAEITFNFWYNLSETIYRELLNMRKESFQPYYQALFEQLVLLCHHDYDVQGIPDTKSDFGEFRSRVVELVKDAAFMVGSTNIFSQLCQKICHDLGKVTWVDTEAKLFIMAAVAPNVELEKSDDILALLQQIFNKQSSLHIAVKHTAITMIGELASWINKNPQLLDKVLSILYQAIQTKEISSAAATALKLVCSLCQKIMAHHFSLLLQVVQAIDSLDITPLAILDFFQGVARVLSELPQDQIGEGMKKVSEQQVQLLARLLGGQNGSHSDPVVYLDRLATIYRNTTVQPKNGEKHPCFDVAQEVWPVLSMTFMKYQHDIRIMERCCRCVRFVIRCLGEYFCPLLGQLVQQLVQVYSTSPHSCFLYLGSILVDEFGKNKSCVPGLIQMVETFCPATFRFLNSDEAFIQHPDTVDDLFRLSTRCVQKCPIEFLKCSMADSLVKCAIAATSLAHREANSSVMTFLRDLIHGPDPEFPATEVDNLRNLVSQVLARHGQNIVSAGVRACAGELPSFMVATVGDVLWELMRFNKQMTSGWLGKALEQLPTKTVSGTNIVTKHQLMEFHHAITTADDCRVVTKATRTFSKLYD